MNLDTQEHLTTLRGLLEYRIRELGSELHAAAQAREAGGVLQGDAIDRKDVADARQRTEVDTESERICREELALCEQALHRLDQGIYGDCMDCGEGIALARLRVQPEAQRCADCQAAHEHRHPAHRP